MWDIEGHEIRLAPPGSGRCLSLSPLTHSQPGHSPERHLQTHLWDAHPKQILQAPQNEVPPGATVSADGTASTHPPGGQPPTHSLTQQAIIKY